jgi:glycosyltransferase involved in cell wall biosynthesis
LPGDRFGDRATRLDAGVPAGARLRGDVEPAFGAVTLAAVRVLVVTNMSPDPSYPGRGSFVRDQVAALRELGVDVTEHWFPPGSRHYIPATRAIRRLVREQSFDLVHAHYGLAGWCARLAGARPLIVTFHGNDVRHPVTGRLSRVLVRSLDLVAPVSRALLGPEDDKPGLPAQPGRTAILPCGANLERFRPLDRADARARLGLEPDGRYLLFPASPAREVKRFDRAEEVARLADAQLLHGGTIDPADLPLWMNAANAVLVPSANEGFGLVAVEALACDVPVLSTPVGIAPTLLRDIDGCLAAPFAAEAWATLARAHLDASDPRVRGRARAEWFSAELLAARVLVAYRELLAESAQTATVDSDADLA